MNQVIGFPERMKINYPSRSNGRTRLLNEVYLINPAII